MDEVVIKSKNKILRALVFIFGTFLLAINYNLILLPNNLVIGGTSGLSVILKDIINPQVFITVTSFLLIIVSYFLLDKKTTWRNLAGAILYPVFIHLTVPLANKLLPYFTFESMFLTVLLSGFLFGFANGIIYKVGYTTGGSDIIMLVVSKYLKIQEGLANRYVNGIVILIGGFTFGFTKLIYALIILFISTELINRILIGISDSKMFYIYTKENKKIEKFILEELGSGVTIFDSEGGFSKKARKILMCVVKTSDYYYFKEHILAIDPNAFLVVTDCYEVSGGVKRQRLAFLNK